MVPPKTLRPAQLEQASRDRQAHWKPGFELGQVPRVIPSGGIPSIHAHMAGMSPFINSSEKEK
jgi:hypothetical protein